MENIIEEKDDQKESELQKYCNNCDIVFTYENTLAAHKKFYCKGLSKNENNSSSPNSNVSPPISAETTVL